MDKEKILEMIDELAEKFDLDRQVVVHMLETGKLQELLEQKNKDNKEGEE